MVKSQNVHKEPIMGSHVLPYRETGMSGASHYPWWAFCFKKAEKSTPWEEDRTCKIMNKKILRLAFGAGGTLKMENGFLSYQNPYGRTFRVLIKDIETVTVDVKGWGNGILKIIGKGTELAQEKMPVMLANKCQSWILENK
jgi:hypothetical protein